ncbi:hypothetical protein ACO0LO_17995 [Undibacterium sp. TJN25]|uniref:hypothetical protein n=1 Tax=Undibacterium sp. TJN25 TaxID=3413056 RepID=UPI003BF30ECE
MSQPKMPAAMKMLRCVLLIMFLLPGFVQAQQAVTNTVLSPETAEFSCTQSSSGKCHYLIVASVCSEEVGGAQKQKSCKYNSLYAFALRVGEKKEFSDLPANFLYCMKSAAPPTVDFCVKYPAKR